MAGRAMTRPAMPTPNFVRHGQQEVEGAKFRARRWVELTNQPRSE